MESGIADTSREDLALRNSGSSSELIKPPHPGICASAAQPAPRGSLPIVAAVSGVEDADDGRGSLERKGLSDEAR